MKGLWIGLSIVKTGQKSDPLIQRYDMTWTDGSKFGDEFFTEASFGRSEGCVRLKKDDGIIKYSDTSCNNEFTFVCKIANTSSEYSMA